MFKMKPYTINEDLPYNNTIVVFKKRSKIEISDFAINIKKEESSFSHSLEELFFNYAYDPNKGLYVPKEMPLLEAELNKYEIFLSSYLVGYPKIVLSEIVRMENEGILTLTAKSPSNGKEIIRNIPYDLVYGIVLPKE